MLRKVEPEMVAGFIAEARGYLPLILQGLEAYWADPGQVEKLEEAHRLIHIIRGSSSMVGLAELSDTAHRLEETVDGLSHIILGEQHGSR